MTPFIQMTWESGGNIYGYYYWKFWRKLAQKEGLHSGDYLPYIQFRWSDTSEMAHRMAAFPRWRNLKHFNSVTTTQFSDGQAFYDILKVWAAYVSVAFFWLLTVVYPAVYCWFSSKKLSPSTLHPSLPVFSNPGWPTMYDWKSAQETSTGFVCIRDAVRSESCYNSTFMLFAIT